MTTTTKSILAFGSHPDDVEIGCGGTLARLLGQGATATHACLTSGEAGKQSMEPAALAALREEEAKEAARRLGSKEVRFLRYPDGETTVRRAWKVELIALIREVRPDVVFTHATSDLFPDHQLYCKLVLDAIRGAAGPWYPESPGKPHRVGTVYGYEVWHPIPEPTFFVDVTAYWEKKAHALEAFRSQVEEIDYRVAFDGLSRYRGILSRVGERAEAFEVLQLPPLC